MKDLSKQIYDYIDENRDYMISLWREIVSTESFTKSPQNVFIFAEKLKTEFENCGMDCKIIPTEPNGPTLVGTLGLERKNKPILFSGHMDTVFEIGTIDERPFKIEGEKAFGPGVLDMKGGIIIALFVIKALNHIGYDERPIKILFAGDEECGHFQSEGGNILMKEAEDALCAFNMETGLVNNDICIGRKGRIGCNLHIEGRSAHAGNDFKSGRSAIEEAALKIAKIRELTDLEKGTTCVATVIDCPSKIANSFPKYCSVSFDIRFEKVSEAERVKAELEKIAAESLIGDTTTTIEYVGIMMPYETTDNVLKLFDFVSEIADEYGFEKLGTCKLGGSSDASYLTMANIPTLCSCGVRGEWNHTAYEYALVDTLLDRAKLWATVVLNANRMSF